MSLQMDFALLFKKSHVNDAQRISSGGTIRDNNKLLIQTSKISLSGIKTQSCLI